MPEPLFQGANFPRRDDSGSEGGGGSPLCECESAVPPAP